jgi:hypothetical protein
MKSCRGKVVDRAEGGFGAVHNGSPLVALGWASKLTALQELFICQQGWPEQAREPKHFERRWQGANLSADERVLTAGHAIGAVGRNAANVPTRLSQVEGAAQ